MGIRFGFALAFVLGLLFEGAWCAGAFGVLMFARDDFGLDPRLADYLFLALIGAVNLYCLPGALRFTSKVSAAVQAGKTQFRRLLGETRGWAACCILATLTCVITVVAKLAWDVRIF